MLMLYLLLVSGLWVAVPLAIACAFTASYCSFQGLALWPVGLICLFWISGGSRKILLWGGAAIVAIGIYFWNYTSHPTGLGVKYVVGVNTASISPTFALHHPVQLAQFILIEMGKVVPNDHLWLSGTFGAIVLATAIFVLVQSSRRRSGYLPVALIVFGLLFDAFIAVGRAPVGLGAATQSRYTMANVLIVVAIVSYSWVHVPERKWAAVSGLLALSVLFGVTTASGIASAESFENTLHIGARLVVNRNTVPNVARGCYSLYGFFIYVDPVPVIESPLFNEAQEERLGAFGAPYRTYRAEGLPYIRQCR